MSRIVIKNVGPIRNVDINLNRVNVFIGPQSSGKSTIAKIVSSCSWVEKEVATMMDENAVADANAFLSLMVDFHKMINYFDEESEVLFETDVIRVSLKGRQKSIQLKDQKAYRREKICYIPSERNSVTLPELQGFEFGQTNLRSFLFDWFNARESYGEDNKTDILDLGVRYFYDPSEIKYKDQIEHINGKTYRIPLGSASSGLQSVIPLQIMIQYYSNQYFDLFAEKTSYDSEVKLRKIRQQLTDAIVLQKMFPDEYNTANRGELIKKVNGLLHKADAQAVSVLRDFQSEMERLTVPERTSFIIEEPEQNLFPRTQMDLLFNIISEIKNERNHKLLMTTHSPYVLYALNNCLMAYLVKENLEENVKTEIDCVKYALNPKEVSVWSLKDGCVRNEKDEINGTIQDERGLIRKNYFNEVMRQVMGDFNKLLEYDD
jgi:ABC-type cobalamin/Fe3+-siderophores transport system ATPase subunit